jgi:hypothetical protein
VRILDLDFSALPEGHAHPAGPFGLPRHSSQGDGGKTVPASNGERDRDSSGPPSPSSHGPSLDGVDQLLAARTHGLASCRPLRLSWNRKEADASPCPPARDGRRCPRQHTGSQVCGTAHPSSKRDRTAHPGVSSVCSPTKSTG